MSSSHVGMTLNGVWRIDALLGTGGMGLVYRAHQLTLGRDVAVKLLEVGSRREAGRDPAFRERFFLEASASAKLSHPNIVTVYEYGRVEGSDPEVLFIAMELLAGETLHDRLRRLGTLPLQEALYILGEVTRGLREAHRQGLVHRDLKPGNIMLVPGDDGERVKVLDFGLVKRVDGPEDQELTAQGSFLGSPKYISPEQVIGTPVDHRADLYALGVIAFQCLTGQVPFRGETSIQTMMSRVTSDAPSLNATVGPGVFPDALERFVGTLLQREPSRRYDDATATLRALRELQELLGLVPVASLSGEWSGASRPAPVGFTAEPSGQIARSSPHTLTGAQLAPPREARRRGLFGIAALALLLLVIPLALYLRPASPVASPAASPPPAMAPIPPMAPPAAPPTAPAAPVPEVAAPAPAAAVPTPGVPAAAPAVDPRDARPSRAARIRAPRVDAAPPTTTPSPRGEAFLTVDTSPWTEVSLDGRSLGTTPLLRARVEAGEHRLSFRNRELGINVTRTLSFAPGESVTRRFTFD